LRNLPIEQEFERAYETTTAVLGAAAVQAGPSEERQ
jgi:hypothetical protein